MSALSAGTRRPTKPAAGAADADGRDPAALGLLGIESPKPLLSLPLTNARSALTEALSGSHSSAFSYAAMAAFQFFFPT